MKSFCRIRSILPKLFGALRVLATLFVVLAIGLVGVVHAAERSLAERLRGIGESVLEFEGLKANSAPRRVSVNGLEFRLVTLSTTLDVPATLDRLAVLCDGKAGIEAPEGLLGREPGRDRSPSGFMDGVLRRETERDGLLACIDTGMKLELSELVQRLDEVRLTGDLEPLGGLRYVLARRSGETTTVLLLWTDGSFPFLRAFPPRGDAPGLDPADLPRAPDTRRLLSAAEHGAPYAVTLYEAAGKTPRDLLGWYENDLVRVHWSVRRDEAKDVLVATHAGRTIVVRTGRTKNGATVASIVELSR